ncbi:Flp family type IVb pilin [Sphingobium sp. CR2-8]|uniref:Flp family type IVb pilin n=1 Tax=Sphingobium sp. CR2-8 TaxID=1306534 RepID=UPI002DBA1C8C|nr:Flp family type IVb pilin [Sphingobium sp. CR2-8]MEC3910087.1 Flp family type IVb pilin [Sphingobium sp. CR2-8]
MKKFKTLLRDSKGATAIEYGLIAALISVAAIGALTAVGGNVNKTFQNASDTLAAHVS